MIEDTYMNILSPSLLSANFTHLEQGLWAIEDGGAAYLHIDVIQLNTTIQSVCRKVNDAYFHKQMVFH